MSAAAVISRLDRELRDLWKPTGEAEAPALARVCTMNLEVVAPSRELLERYAPVVDEVTSSIPARAILASIEPTAPEGLEGAVSAVCFPHGSTKICSERVLLHAGGRAAAGVASAVEALLVPELPTVLVWLGRVHVDDPVFQDLANDVHRIVLDSDYTSITTLLKVARWARTQPNAPKIADLAWMRISMWQELLARFFDDEDTQPLARAVTKLTLRQASDPGVRLGADGALALGWIGTRLGLSVYHTGGALRFARPDGGEVELSLGAVPRPPGVAPHSLAAVEVEAAIGGRSLHGHIERELGTGLPTASTPDADVVRWMLTYRDGAAERVAEHQLRLGSNKAAKWLERVLHRSASDAAFEESVAFAEKIVDDGLDVGGKS